MVANQSSPLTHWDILVERELDNGRNLLFDAAIEEMERQLLPIVMHRCGGSQVKASRALGITRGSLRKKLRQHGFLAPSPLADRSELNHRSFAEPSDS